MGRENFESIESNPSAGAPIAYYPYADNPLTQVRSAAGARKRAYRSRQAILPYSERIRRRRVPRPLVGSSDLGQVLLIPSWAEAAPFGPCGSHHRRRACRCELLWSHQPDSLNLAIPRFSNVLFRTTQVFFLEAEGSSRADIKNRLKKLKNFVGIDEALPFYSVCQGTTRMEYL